MTPAQVLLSAKIGAVGLLFLAVFMWGYIDGKNGVQAAWDRDRAKRIEAQAALIEKHDQEIAALRKKQDAVNLKVTDDYQIALQILGKTYDENLASIRASGGLRIPRPACPTVATTETASNSGHNEATTGTIALPEEVERRLFDLVKSADETLEQARACQNWIRSQGFYGARFPHQ